MTRALLATLLVGATVFPAAPAAADAFGSAQRSTNRSCATTAAGAACDGTGAGQGITSSVYGGGAGVFGSATLNLADGSYARSTVSRGDLALPVIRAETRAVGNERLNVNAFGFQSYTFSGTDGTPFSLTADLHIVGSSTDDGAGTLANGAIYTDYVAIWDPSILAGLNTAPELFTALFYAACGTPGVLGVGGGSGALPGGEATYSITTTACSPGSLDLTTGQQILAVAGVQLPVNRGGYADATHSFTVRLDPTLPQETRDSLAANLTAAVVPEPATWAVIVVGTGLIGGALRRRRAIAFA